MFRYRLETVKLSTFPDVTLVTRLLSKYNNSRWIVDSRIQILTIQLSVNRPAVHLSMLSSRGSRVYTFVCAAIYASGESFVPPVGFRINASQPYALEKPISQLLSISRHLPFEFDGMRSALVYQSLHFEN